MTKEEYKQALQNPKWKKKRLKILDRDGHKCRKCDCTKNLHVHHIHYIEGNMPWQVPDDYLITLCTSCHKKEHDNKPIYTFVIIPKGVKKERKKTTDRKRSKKQLKAQPVLSDRDKLLQEKYNRLKREGKLKV